MWKFLIICVVMIAFNSEADAASGKYRKLLASQHFDNLQDHHIFKIS